MGSATGGLSLAPIEHGASRPKPSHRAGLAASLPRGGCDFAGPRPPCKRGLAPLRTTGSHTCPGAPFGRYSTCMVGEPSGALLGVSGRIPFPPSLLRPCLLLPIGALAHRRGRRGDPDLAARTRDGASQTPTCRLTDVSTDPRPGTRMIEAAKCRLNTGGAAPVAAARRQGVLPTCGLEPVVRSRDGLLAPAESAMQVQIDELERT